MWRVKASGRENWAVWVRRLQALHRNVLLHRAGLCLYNSQGKQFKWANKSKVLKSYSCSKSVSRFIAPDIKETARGQLR